MGLPHCIACSWPISHSMDGFGAVMNHGLMGGDVSLLSQKWHQSFPINHTIFRKLSSSDFQECWKDVEAVGWFRDFDSLRKVGRPGHYCWDSNPTFPCVSLACVQQKIECTR